ncbi:MAG TPA: hypothetical protein PK020_16475 [Ilumatobacteraceae bacterium]|nr:hypothetical protein [Ilumatobacteraceae bacterium]
MNIRLKLALAGVIVVGSLGLSAGVASAVEEGNWSTSCVSGKVCFFEGNWGAGASASTLNNDSNFSGNCLYVGASCSKSLNDGGKTWGNSLTGGGASYRVYTNSNYGGSASACTPPGTIVGPYAVGSSGGYSSVRGGTSAGC